MSLTIASNIASIKAQTSVARTTDALSKTFERLSSGLRINRASDDPAGLALADALRKDTTVASAAIRNTNDGISLTAIADAALGEIGNILTRMAELATESSNGTYSQSQRSALSSEFVALGSEVQRIAVTTTFNNITILSASTNIALQVGLDGTSNSQITVSGVLGTLEALGLAGSGSSAMSYSIISTTSVSSQTAATNALSAVNNAINALTVTRGTVGAVQSRLNSAVNFLTVVRENYAAAQSRIRDADIAQEVADMVRLQILQQAGTAILAQANLQPQVALKLLQ